MCGIRHSVSVCVGSGTARVLMEYGATCVGGLGTLGVFVCVFRIRQPVCVFVGSGTIYVCMSVWEQALCVYGIRHSVCVCVCTYACVLG